MAGRGVDQPHGTHPVVDDVPDATSTCDLELPLFEILAVVTVNREVATETMLALVIRARAWIRAQDFKTAPCVGQGVPAQFLPPPCRITGGEANVPLIVRRGNGDTIPAFGTHTETSTGPKSPLVGLRASAYSAGSALIRAVARQPTITSSALLSKSSSAASDRASTSSNVKFRSSSVVRWRTQGKTSGIAIANVLAVGSCLRSARNKRDAVASVRSRCSSRSAAVR